MPPVFVKIDGVTNADDALLAIAMGADAVGFVFAESPRQISPEIARAIVDRLPRHVLAVGVFVNEAPPRVVEAVRVANVGAAQLHGTETAADTCWIRERIPMVVKAFAAGDAALHGAADYCADAVIVDSPAGGGSGTAYDWAIARRVPSDVRLILAGGLTAENVSDAILAVRPWGVDVSSGVESSPGRKDRAKLRSFITAAKSALPA